MANLSHRLDGVFYALSDPTRRAVLHRLAAGPATVTSLAEPFGMALPSFLKHVSVLETCGLIESQKAGRVRTCKIKPREFTTAERWFADQRERWEAQASRLAAYAETLADEEEGNG